MSCLTGVAGDICVFNFKYQIMSRVNQMKNLYGFVFFKAGWNGKAVVESPNEKHTHVFATVATFSWQKSPFFWKLSSGFKNRRLCHFGRQQTILETNLVLVRASNQHITCFQVQLQLWTIEKIDQSMFKWIKLANTDWQRNFQSLSCPW